MNSSIDLAAASYSLRDNKVIAYLLVDLPTNYIWSFCYFNAYQLIFLHVYVLHIKD